MRTLKIFLIFVVLSSLTFALRKKRCRALALEGGGSQGAYQAGAFRALVEFVAPEEIAYDVIAGSSVGSINGMLISAYAPGEEKTVMEQMNHLWSIIKSDSIYTGWTLGWIRGFIDKPSFLDNSPLKPFLEARLKEVGGQMKRKFSISVVDANSARSIIYNTTVGAKNVPTYIVASASIPGFFPPLKKDGYVFIDGGVNDNMNLRGAVAKCIEMTGGDESAITIDFIMTNPLKHDVGDYSSAKSMTQYFRGKNLRDAINDRWHCNYTQKAHPKINWRYSIIPLTDVSKAAVPLDFSSKQIQAHIKQGYNDAKRVILGKEPNLLERYLNSQPARIRLSQL